MLMAFFCVNRFGEFYISGKAKFCAQGFDLPLSVPSPSLFSSTMRSCLLLGVAWLQCGVANTFTSDQDMEKSLKCLDAKKKLEIEYQLGHRSDPPDKMMCKAATAKANEEAKSRRELGQAGCFYIGEAGISPYNGPLRDTLATQSFNDMFNNVNHATEQCSGFAGSTCTPDGEPCWVTIDTVRDESTGCDESTFSQYCDPSTCGGCYSCSGYYIATIDCLNVPSPPPPPESPPPASPVVVAAAPVTTVVAASVSVASAGASAGSAILQNVIESAAKSATQAAVKKGGGRMKKIKPIVDKISYLFVALSVYSLVQCIIDYATGGAILSLIGMILSILALAIKPVLYYRKKNKAKKASVAVEPAIESTTSTTS
jgi:hypothetical protein